MSGLDRIRECVLDGGVLIRILAKVNSALFPGETAVGYPGVTLTGVEPAAIQTAPVYPYSDETASEFPLVADQPEGGSNFDVFNTGVISRRGTPSLHRITAWGMRAP
jgi:hypothetical protein